MESRCMAYRRESHRTLSRRRVLHGETSPGTEAVTTSVTAHLTWQRTVWCRKT